jgi:NADPH-ferrihemoprotein reductase
MVIFWGSQSGTAEDFAHRLSNELQQSLGVVVSPLDLQSYDHQSLTQVSGQKLVVFILATYGEGDPPDNTNAFLSTLRVLREKGACLDNLRYAIFGLGNSTYRHYNRVSVNVDASFQEFGATRIGRFGEADDAKRGASEESFMHWKQEIKSEVRQFFGLKERPAYYQPTVSVDERRETSQADTQVYLGEPHSSFLGDAPSLRTRDPRAPVVVNICGIKELYTSKDRCCIHLDLSIEESSWVKYQTGDHLAVWPMNSLREVDRLLEVLDLKGKQDVCIRISSSKSANGRNSRIPSLTTIGALFQYYLEIGGVVSRDLLTGLSEFSPTPEGRAILQRIVTDSDLFNKEFPMRYVNFTDILEKLGNGSKWCIPLSFLIERLKKTQPRYYSISSSAIINPRKLSITAVVDLNTGSESGCQTGAVGMTSNYLLALNHSLRSETPTDVQPGDSYNLSGPRNILKSGKVFAGVRTSKFKLPSNPSTPIIMIGAGTGVAPFRAFVQERARLKTIGREIGTTILLLGFRKPNEDFLYSEEWIKYRQILGPCFKLWTAFSREENKPKMHVQDRLEEHADEVLSLLRDEDRSSIYVCGSAAMAKDVRATLASMWTHQNGGGEREGDEWLRELQRTFRLHRDVWG